MTATQPVTPEAAHTVNMGDEELMRHPAQGYSRIREVAPLVRGVVPGVDPAWIVSRYDDVAMVLNDPRFVSNPENIPGMTVPSLGDQVLRLHGTPPEYLKYRLARMGLFDGAEHARLRGLVSHAFSARHVAEHRKRVTEIADELLDRLPEVAEDGVVDLMVHFGHALPSTVLCELVGIPMEARPQGQKWTGVIWSVLEQGKVEAIRQGKATAWREMVEFVQALIKERRAQPGDDLVSELIRAQNEDPDRLNDIELIAMIVMLALSARQTTAYLIATGTIALFTHPEQLALLRRNPDLMPRAIHEMLRWCTPTHVSPRMRYATEDVEIGGMPVRKGEAVWLALIAANYDPRRFDDPERFDITREPDRHLSFAGGEHYCLGSALAKLELEVAFDRLLHRFPDLALAVDPADVDRELMPFQYRVTSLPVRL
jgi:cytochrome P450